MENTFAAHARKASLRERWPTGLLGWLSYLHDCRLRGYERPINWNALWMWEQTGHGRAVFANGGVLILHGDELDAFRLLAKGLLDAEVAAALKLAERKVRSFRNEVALRLGASTVADLNSVVASNGLQA